MNKHKSNKIKENSNTVRHLIMGQITTTQNLVAIKEVRHAGQQRVMCMVYTLLCSAVDCRCICRFNSCPQECFHWYWGNKCHNASEASSALKIWATTSHVLIMYLGQSNSRIKPFAYFVWDILCKISSPHLTSPHLLSSPLLSSSLLLSSLLSALLVFTFSSLLSSPHLTALLLSSPISSHLISSHLISSHLNLISAQLNSAHLILSYW